MAPYVRDLVRDHKFDFICFQESMLQDLFDECIRKVDPNKIYLWDWIPSKGKAGGIISGFNVDRFDVGARDQEEYILKHYLWDKRLERKWNLLNIYVSPHDEFKEYFLSEFEKRSGPYLSLICDESLTCQGLNLILRHFGSFTFIL
jgi:hypothetical protein